MLDKKRERMEEGKLEDKRNMKEYAK